MKKWIACLGSLLLPCVSVAETLRVLNWEEYLSPVVIEKWQRETGVTIEQVYFDNDEARDQLLASSEEHRIDIAVIDEIASRMFGNAGKLADLGGLSELALESIEPFWRQRCSRFSMPYMWGTMGLAYRRDKFSTPPSSWGDVLQPTEALKGHIGMLLDHADTLSPALFYLGHPMNTADRDHLREAYRLLQQQLPHVLTYDYPVTFLKTDRRADELHLAVVYGGDQYSMSEISGDDWDYTIPQEGTVLWVDCLAVVAGSKNEAMARRFLAFLNRPEIAAENAEYVYFATPNREALQFVSEEFRTDPEVFISLEARNRSELYEVLNLENVKLRQRITSSLHKLHESH